MPSYQAAILLDRRILAFNRSYLHLSGHYPDPVFYSVDEIEEFLKTRKFIERILVKKVEIVAG